MFGVSDIRCAQAVARIIKVFLLWLLLSSCFMFDFKSFCCYDVKAVAQLQIQLELNFCLLCSNQAHRNSETMENFLKNTFQNHFTAFCFMIEIFCPCVDQRLHK